MEEVAPNGRSDYNARKPTQALRAVSVEQISISISIVKDSLPDLTTKNHLLIYAVGLSRIKDSGGRKYEVYTVGNSPNPYSYSLLIANFSSSTPFSLFDASVSCNAQLL